MGQSLSIQHQTSSSPGVDGNLERNHFRRNSHSFASIWASEEEEEELENWSFYSNRNDSNFFPSNDHNAQNQSLQQQQEGSSRAEQFPDLGELPPELALTVLSHLNATDLCLAACVWQKLASDEILWHGLCRQNWPQVSIYDNAKRSSSVLPYRKIFLLLDEGTLTFNSDPERGMNYFFDLQLLRNDPTDIAKFFSATSKLSKRQMRLYLQKRTDVVDKMIHLQNYEHDFLPNALRKCFSKLEAPNDRGRYLQELLESFSKRFCQCNPQLGYSEDSVYVMCFSLILLSVDLSSPHVKNKMSKREFIRNTRNAITPEMRNNNNNNWMQEHLVNNQQQQQMQEQLDNQEMLLQLQQQQLIEEQQEQLRFERAQRRWQGRQGLVDDLLGEMYDNVFLRGHVSSCDEKNGGKLKMNQNRFIPGYLAIFL